MNQDWWNKRESVYAYDKTDIIYFSYGTDFFLNNPFDLSADDDVVPVLWRNRVAENYCAWLIGGENF